MFRKHNEDSMMIMIIDRKRDEWWKWKLILDNANVDNDYMMIMII